SRIPLPPAPGPVARRSLRVRSRSADMLSSCTNRWSSSSCFVARRRVGLKRLLSLCGPQRPRLFALITLELVGHPKQRAEDRGAVIASQIDDTGFDDEAAEFDEMPRALAAPDLPRAHVMSRPCCLMAVARRPVAPERRQRRAQ